MRAENDDWAGHHEQAARARRRFREPRQRRVKRRVRRKSLFPIGASLLALSAWAAFLGLWLVANHSFRAVPNDATTSEDSSP